MNEDMIFKLIKIQINTMNDMCYQICKLGVIDYETYLRCTQQLWRSHSAFEAYETSTQFYSTSTTNTFNINKSMVTTTTNFRLNTGNK
jgi:hypothetical protein